MSYSIVSSRVISSGMMNNIRVLFVCCCLYAYNSPELPFSDKSKSRNGTDPKEPPASKEGSTAHIAAQTFTFKELASATKNFRPESLLGEGGFGRVYKGRLESTGQVTWTK